MAAINITPGHKYILCTEEKFCPHNTRGAAPGAGGGCAGCSAGALVPRVPGQAPGAPLPLRSLSKKAGR